MAINITDIEGGDVQLIELYTGPRGESSEIFTGIAPPSNSVGENNDVYIVTTGSAGIGDVYKKTTGEWVLKGNTRGPIGPPSTHTHPVTDVTGLQAALNAKEPTIAPGTTSQYFRGDKTWQTLVPPVDLTTAQTIGGVKTFSTAPVVPNNSFTIAKTSGLQAELDLKTAYVQAKGTDLVVNGFGTMGNNTNFSQFTYTAADAPTGAAGSFLSPAYSGTFFVDEMIPVDPNRKLKFSFQVRQTGAATTGRLYGLVYAYDAYKQGIAPNHYMYIPGTLTTLAAPLNPGDTTVKLTSGANWYGQAGKAAGGSTHLRSIIWWDYVDPGGKQWPELTYSRNLLGVNAWADGAVVGNTITLNAPYAGPVKPAGTKLSNGSSGGTYIYVISAANVIATPEWTTYGGTISGVTNGGGAPTGLSASFATGWPPGTSYTKAGWLLNRDATGLTVPGSRIAVAAVSFSDATAAQDMATGALDIANAKAPVVHGHALTDANITGVLPLAKMPVHGHALTDSNVTGVLPLAQLPTHTHTKAQITDLGEVSGGSQINPAEKLAPLYAALAGRNSRPARIAFFGSSTTFGLAASSDKFRYVDQMIHSLQSSYPSAIPGHFPEPQTLSQGAAAGNPPGLPGVYGFNAGAGGANSTNYCNSIHLYALGIINPDCVVHMIGSNDSIDHVSYAVAPAAYKVNVSTVIDSMDATSASGTPLCHVLVHAYRRTTVTEAHWSLYREALREIADARDNVLFVDLNEIYAHNKMPGDDPYGLLSSDTVHQTDAGHALMADTILKAMGLSSATTADQDLVVKDTFTQPNGVLLGPELLVGRPWNIESGVWEVQDNKLMPVTDGSVVVETGLTDIDISAIVNTGDNMQLAGLIWRAGSGENSGNRYTTLFSKAYGTVQIYRTAGLSGTTTVAQANYPFESNKDYWVRTIVKGDKVTNYINGKNVLSYTIPAGDSFNNYTSVGFRVSSHSIGLSFRGFAGRRV